MPLRLWIMIALLSAAIAVGSVFALQVGVAEIRLLRSGPIKQLFAEEVVPGTAGWLQVMGCARHDLEVAISTDGEVVTGERDARDRIFFALTSQSDCEEDTKPESLHIRALVQSQDASKQGLSRLYEKGYVPPPTKVIVDGVIGFGAEDSWRSFLAKDALRKRLPSVDHLPILVKGRRPASAWVAYTTAAVGVHGLLLIVALCYMIVRRQLRRGMPVDFSAEAEDDSAT